MVSPVRSNSLRTAIFATASLLACPGISTAATPTTATQAVVTASVVQPMYGNLKPFYGDLSAFYGNLKPFYGNLKPFYGNLKPFWGDVGPLYGNLRPFWGSVDPFVANTSAAVVSTYGAGYDPFWGSGNANPYLHNPSPYVNYSQIAGFWNTEGANWAKVQSAWSAATTNADYVHLAKLLQTTIVNPAAAFWGQALRHATPSQQASTQSLMAALQSSGVTLNSDGSINAASLAGVSPTDRAMLFLNVYDGLMAYAGTGHVDWWMGATHWSPALAATVGGKDTPVTVGMLDFTVSNSEKNAKGTLLQYGSSVFSNGHGAAVGSLIMGSLDGSGIMGVMSPGAAKVIVYDPYDATGTTNWTDVGTGIQVLANSTFSKKGAPTGVLNASLGVPGWTLHPGWNDALSSGAAQGHNLVIAAGNEGVTQTTNVPWNFATNPNILLVGSVGVDGTISNFSNRPGEACLLDAASTSTLCVEANKLKYRFIVAPGELVLVSDGNGGFIRQSGTSLAAPLVSAAIGLLQERWPWLANHPDETAEIILKSATPMGEHPGADAVYGAGELNIQASQSPLNWKTLQYYPVLNGKVSATALSASGVVTLVSGGNPTSWNASKLSITALETVGGTYRDFQIPLANSLVGQNAPRGSGTGIYQSYLATSLKAWVAGGGQFVGGDPMASGALTYAQSSATVGRVFGLDLRMHMAPREVPLGFTQGSVTTDADFALVGERSDLRFGVGQGSAAMDGQQGFASASDYDLRRGGANPLLGLASGGAFVNWRMHVLDRLSLNVGATQRRDARDLSLFGFASPASPARIYQASAEHFGLDYAVTDDLTVHTAVTHLREASGLLGVQSLDPAQLGAGSSTTGATLGFDWALGHDVVISAAGTLANTTTAAGQSLRTAPGGLRSSAAEVAVSKARVFSEEDRLRLTLAKSMQVYAGRLAYTSYGVVDRQTGALGLIDQSVDAGGGSTPWSAEVMYGRLLRGQTAEVSAFLRSEANTEVLKSSRSPNYVVGGKYRLVF